MPADELALSVVRTVSVSYRAPLSQYAGMSVEAAVQHEKDMPEPDAIELIMMELESSHGTAKLGVDVRLVDSATDKPLEGGKHRGAPSWPEWLEGKTNAERVRLILTAVTRCYEDGHVDEEPRTPHMTKSMAENFLLAMLPATAG